MAELHDKITLPGASNALQVKIADGPVDPKLYVGRLPLETDETQLQAAFGQLGEIRECVARACAADDVD